MKKLFILLLVFATFSCSNENDLNEMEDTISKNFSIEKFIGSAVAYKSNNEIKLGVSETKIINSFNKYSERVNLGKRAISMELLNIDDQNYFRFYNEDNSVSTVAVTSVGSAQDDVVIVGQTVCTSSACSNGGGCLPNGPYCTKCTRDRDDCQRSTSTTTTVSHSVN